MTNTPTAKSASMPDAGPVVRKRRVFHITGYDGRLGEAPFGLFRREFLKRKELRCENASLSEPWADGTDLTWVASFGDGKDEVAVLYTLLRWDDIVRDDQNRPFLKRSIAAARTLGNTLASGAFSRFRTANPKFARLWIGPYLACLVGPLIGLLSGIFIHLVLGAGIGVATAIATALSIALLAITVSVRAETLFDQMPIPGTLSLGRIGQLFDLWGFADAYAKRERPDVDRRLEKFAKRIETAMRDKAFNEVLVIGHSMGAVLAVDVVDRVLHRGATATPAIRRHLSLLTLGALHELPAAYPGGSWIKDMIGRVAQSPLLHWREYRDESDPFNFPYGDFMERLGIERGEENGNPHLFTAGFRESLSEASFNRSRLHLFRMHFQFVMTNGTPEGYDFFRFLSSHLLLAQQEF